jgi:myo-inositol-1(or 4)-monophosphatase
VPAADASTLLALAERLAREAGRRVQLGAEAGIAHIATKSTGTDMVTEHDRAAELLIVGGLRAARPDDTVVGEEGTREAGGSGIAWLVDPIDGTTNFLYGLPGYSVSIAAADPDGPLAGVVYVPSFDEMYTAARGLGARCNNAPIHCRSTTDLSTSLVATGFGYDRERRSRQARVLQHVLGEVRDIRRVGSAANDLCMVACGRVDAYFEDGLQPWDLAAGELIAREAGAVTSGVEGGAVTTIAAAPGVYDALRRLLAEGGAPGLP